MKSWILYRVNGQREELADWNQVNWSKVYKVIKSLRKRIFRARKLGQWKQLRRLQKLMMKSYANLLHPQKEKVLEFCKELGKTIKSCGSWSQANLITKLNPKLRGFANYYRGVVSSDTFSYITYRIWKYLWRWAKRRHPMKSITWVKNRYFPRHKNREWTFMCWDKDSRGNEKEFILFDVSTTPIRRHIKVKGSNSPDDPNLTEYWNKRTTKQGKQFWAKGSKYEQIAKEQNYRCPMCNQFLFNGEEIETHHLVPVKEGGSNNRDNLTHLHKACHKQVHGKQVIKA